MIGNNVAGAISLVILSKTANKINCDDLLSYHIYRFTWDYVKNKVAQIDFNIKHFNGIYDRCSC